jgi:DNA-binding SARP family transcriptional activator
MYEIQLFGSFEVRTRGVRLTARDLGGARPRHVLALLALRGAQSVTELVDVLWPGRPPADPRIALEQQVSLLRRRLDPEGVGRSVVVTRRGGYDLDTDQVRTDVARFDELLAAAGWRTPDRALPPLTAAAHLAGRPLLAGEDGQGWVLRARHLYHGRLVESLLSVGERALAEGLPGTAAELAARALEIAPQVGTAAHRALAVGRSDGD